MRLEHVNLTVSDLPRSVRFYRRLLDLEVRWEGRTSAGRPAAHVGNGECYLALFEGAAAPAVPPADHSRPGFNHLSFVVDDLDGARARLVQLGLEPHFEADYEPGRRFYFRDFDGIEVELVQYARSEDSGASARGATEASAIEGGRS